ncbi:acetolactate decarboxylase [Kiritimatiellaeota bacterium B1221]|nr:acetolactate decarboxylase [Kiritimatiellaeota bacterium B1221]
MKAPFLFSLLLLLGVTACQSPRQSNQVTQVATIDGLLAGIYDGEVTLAEIREAGDFGLGTYQALDGEMLLLDGIFYQVKDDGSVHLPPPETLSPFVAVVDFDPTLYAELEDMNLEELKNQLDELAPDQNQFVAIRIEGDFASIRTRSVPAQSKPYPPLTEVVKTQPVFNFENVEGTLVGLRCPPYVKGLNVPGYHFHFITRDRDAGGHLLALEMRSGQLSADTVHETFTVLLPKNTMHSDDVNLSHDRSHALEAVEKDSTEVK